MNDRLAQARRLVARALPADRHTRVLLTLATILAVTLAFTVGSRFFGIANLQSMSVQVVTFGFLALAMSLAMLAGGIDLSVVSGAALAGISGAYVMSGNLIAVTEANQVAIFALGVVVTLAVGTLCGFLNGFLIAKLSIPPILATLGTMLFYAGIATAVTNGRSVPVAVPVASQFAQATIARIPVVFLVLVAAFVAVGFLLYRRPLGRRIYLRGESGVALRFTGVKAERITVITYTIGGLLVGCAAVMMVVSLNSARVGFGESYLLQAILVVVLAGFNPDGGVGRVGNLAIGIVLLQSLQSAFSIMAWTPFAKNLVWGLLLIVVMIVNFYSSRSTWQRALTAQFSSPKDESPVLADNGKA